MAPPKGHPPYNVNGEGGRPFAWSDEFIEKEAEDFEEWMKVSGNIFLERFTFEKKYPTRRFLEWIEQNRSDRLSHAYTIFKDKQRLALFESGLTGKFKFPMCQMILGNSHGIYLKTEQQVTGSATNPLHFILQNDDGNSKDLVSENGSD